MKSFKVSRAKVREPDTDRANHPCIAIKGAKGSVEYSKGVDLLYSTYSFRWRERSFIIALLRSSAGGAAGAPSGEGGEACA